MRVPKYYLPAPLRIKETAAAIPTIVIDVAGIVRSIAMAVVTIWGLSWGIPSLLKSFTGGTSPSLLQSSTVASYATLFEVMMPLVMIIGMILLVVFLMRSLFSSQEEAPPPPPTTEIIITK